MKKIGILFGQENTFPQAFVESVNSKKVKGIKAELAQVNVVQQGKATDYDVLIDRISQDIPFYRAYLKNSALTGTAVINNPFWLLSIISGIPPTLEATTGRPVAIASRIVRGKLSVKLGSTNISHFAYKE